MAENYSLNSKFGFNVTSNKGNTLSSEELQQQAPKSELNLFDAITGYVQKYENVFTGDVEKEINMYERQAMIVGMNLRASEKKRNFDINI